jgi:hypothetical protein
LNSLKKKYFHDVCQKRPSAVSKETYYSKSLKKEYYHASTISSVQELYRIILEQKNEINDLKTRLARLEAIIDSSFNSRWNHV